MEITKDRLEEIIRIAFKYGEQWGVTYSGWFSPEEEDTERNIQEVLNELL